MRYKNSDDNRYRVQFMRSTEELMDQLTVKEFISYLEENAEFEDYTVEYIDKKCVKCRAYDLTEVQAVLNSKIPTEEDPSQYVGQVGERLDLVVTFKKRSTYEIPSYAGWGTDTVGINVFRDDAGNCFIWKSASAFFNIAEGSQVRLRGTVKEHSDYKGTKQTILQRCKVDAVKL